jgi:hypothetical protein
VRPASCSASTDVHALPRGRQRRTIRCCPWVSNLAFSFTLRPTIDAVTCPRSFWLVAPISDAFMVHQPSTAASRPTENPRSSGGSSIAAALLAMSPAFVLFGFGKQSGQRAVDGWRRKKKERTSQALSGWRRTPLTPNVTEHDGMLLSVNVCIFEWYFT